MTPMPLVSPTPPLALAYVSGDTTRRPPARGDRPLPPLSGLQAMLDEVGHGLMLVDDDARVLYANRAARAELDAGHPLQLLGDTLRARRCEDVLPLHDALMSARRGLRHWAVLGAEENRDCVAVVPLADTGGPVQGIVVMLGRRNACERLSVQAYARVHGLTSAESRVLEALCAGHSPQSIAADHGVGLATVRTQIGAIRAKCGARSIRALVQQVARLPPMRAAF